MNDLVEPALIEERDRTAFDFDNALFAHLPEYAGEGFRYCPKEAGKLSLWDVNDDGRSAASLLAHVEEVGSKSSGYLLKREVLDHSGEVLEAHGEIGHHVHDDRGFTADQLKKLLSGKIEQPRFFKRIGMGRVGGP